MNVERAFVETVRLAGDRGWPNTLTNGCGLYHLRGMQARLQNGMRDGTFSYGKACRWLGWAQGVLQAGGLVTLEEIKTLNAENSDGS